MRIWVIALMLNIAFAAPVMTEITQSAGALEKAVDAAEGIIGAVASFISTLLAAEGTIESAALIDYYDVNKYETSVIRTEHDKETNSIITQAWTHAKKAKEAKNDATKECQHLPSYIDCYEDIIEVQDSAAQANALALAATKRALSLVNQNLKDLEHLGAGWSYYRGEEHDLVIEKARALEETGEYAAMHNAIKAYSIIDTTGKADIVAADAIDIIEVANKLLKGEYFSISITKAPKQYHHAFNTLIGNSGLVFSLLEDNNQLSKAQETMRSKNTAWEKKCKEELVEAKKAHDTLGKEEPWLVDELMPEWEENVQRLREAQYLEKEAVFVREAKQEYWLAISTTRFQEAYDKAVLAQDTIVWISQELRSIEEEKREDCYAKANVTTALAIGLERIAEDHCERGDKATQGRAIKHYEKGVYQKKILVSETPIADVKALILKAKQMAEGDKEKLAQIALLEKELGLAEGLDPESALPLLTSIADRAISLTEETAQTIELPSEEPAESPGGGVEEHEEEGRGDDSEENIEWDTNAAQNKLKDVKKALNTMVDLNFTVATVLDESDWLEFKERMDALERKPEAYEYERKKKDLVELENDLSNAIKSTMQRAKQEYETATVVMEDKKLFDYAFALERSRQEYEKGYYNRAFIYAAYAKAMTATQKSAMTGLAAANVAPVLLGLAVVGGVVWKIRSKKKEPQIRRVLKKVRARESNRSSQHGPTSLFARAGARDERSPKAFGQ